MHLVTKPKRGPRVLNPKAFPGSLVTARDKVSVARRPDDDTMKVLASVKQPWTTAFQVEAQTLPGPRVFKSRPGPFAGPFFIAVPARKPGSTGRH